MAFSDYAAAVLAHAGIPGRAAAGWDKLRSLASSGRRPVSPELAARRRMGRDARDRAMAARGVQAHVYASAHYLWDDET